MLSMNASKVISSKFRHDNSSKKTLAYIGENLKMQKKVAYWNSDEGIYKRRKMISDNIRAYEEALRQQRWEQIEQQEKLNKKNKKFQKETLKNEGYTEFKDFYVEGLKN